MVMAVMTGSHLFPRKNKFKSVSLGIALLALLGCQDESATTEPPSQPVPNPPSPGNVVPGIAAVTGTRQDGSTVTVQGQGFGAMAGDVIQYARGDEGADGTPIEGTNPTIGATLTTYVIGLPNAGADVTGEHLRFSNANPRPGRSRSLRRLRQGLVSAVQRNGGFGYAGRNDADAKLYISYYRHHAWDAVSGTENLKQYYVFGNGLGPAGQHQVPQPILHVPSGSHSWAMGANLTGSDPNVYNSASWNMANSRSVWQRWESYVVLNTPGVADGKFSVWREGALGLSREAFMWQPGGMQMAATGFTDFRLGYMDNSMDNTAIDYSDYYIANTVARVEVCDSDRWTSCSHKELQLTRNSQWSSTAIEVKLNQGAFDSLQGKYLYVIKSDGNPVSELGYQL